MGIRYRLTTDADITSKTAGLNIISMTLDNDDCYREERKGVLIWYLDKLLFEKIWTKTKTLASNRKHLKYFPFNQFWLSDGISSILWMYFLYLPRGNGKG